MFSGVYINIQDKSIQRRLTGFKLLLLLQGFRDMHELRINNDSYGRINFFFKRTWSMNLKIHWGIDL